MLHLMHSALIPMGDVNHCIFLQNTLRIFTVKIAQKISFVG